ncbi:hypothetical protein [Arthrobacter sp. ISL-30]|nr:hypothetical protein [Arthrobacter sp. ISL-30]MBT2513174.1 hypothetical protein [Arthrobacter sp. ISL-30]
MAKRISGPNAVIYKPTVFPSVRTEVFDQLAEPKATADVSVSVIHPSSS